MKSYIFVDDSGNPSVKGVTGDFFLMVGVIFANRQQATRTVSIIQHYRRELGWTERAEFKFRKTKKVFIMELLRRVSQCDFQIYVAYLDKRIADHSLPSGNILYQWAIQKLLQKIPFTDAKIFIDGRASKQYMRQTSTVLRKQLAHHTGNIIQIKFEDSTRNDLVQLADLVAGSINRALQNTKTDAQTYQRIIQDKIMGQTRLNNKNISGKRN